MKPHLVHQLQLEIYLVKFMKIHCHSPRFICLLIGQIGDLNGDVVEVTLPATFKTLMVALFSAISQRLLLVYYFMGRDNSSGFPWPFPPY